MDKSHALIQAKEGGNAEELAAFQKTVDDLTTQLNSCILATMSYLPGRKEVEHAIKVVDASADLINNGGSIQITPGETFQSAQTRLNAAAAALAISTNNLINSTKSGAPVELKASSNQFEENFNRMIASAQTGILLFFHLSNNSS